MKTATSQTTPRPPYTYNDRDQLTELTQGADTWSFAYDPFGRRTTKTKNGVATSYLYDGSNVAGYRYVGS
jgi:YD repeat-containing protein